MALWLYENEKREVAFNQIIYSPALSLIKPANEYLTSEPFLAV